MHERCFLKLVHNVERMNRCDLTTKIINIMHDTYLENRVKINPRTSNGLSRIVSGSVCSECNNTGWILTSNGKLKIMTKSGGLEPCYDNIAESEAMVKCKCGR